ncbi:MAG TPA: hypothetical protein VN260_05775 [Dissulfurispiraceae bacterium]|nr:hypothetical protein [Dissulfurispiraceae bacterium]
MNIDTLLDRFRAFSAKEGFLDDVYLVGGAVRDLIAGTAIKDADLALRGSVKKPSERFAASAGASCVVLDEDFEVVRIALGGFFIDISPLRGGTILDDLAGRDLTINAMALPLKDWRAGMTGRSGDMIGAFIDPFGGIRDIRHCIVRMVSERNLLDDPLRLLRVFRFSATLKFIIETGTLQSVRDHGRLIRHVPAERVAGELRHILAVPFSYKTMREMERSGFLRALFPEMDNLSGDVLTFSLRSYTYGEHVLCNLPLYFFEHAPFVAEYFREPHRLTGLKLALLLYRSGRTEEAALRLKLSVRERDYIDMLLKGHPAVASHERLDGPSKVRLLRRAGDDICALLIFAIAQQLLCQCTDHPLLTFAREMLCLYHDHVIPRMKRLPVLTGDDLIRTFRLTPSPMFGEVLGAVEDAFIQGEIESGDEALALAGRLIGDRRKSR